MSYTPNGLFNHTAAIYQMLTGYPPDRVSPSGQLEPPTPADFPTAGSHVSKLKPPNDPVLPFVELPRPLQESGIIGKGGSAGFLGKAYDPYRMYQDPAKPVKLDDLSLRKDIPPDRLKDRFELLKGINGSMPDLEKALNDYAVDEYYGKAYDLVLSGKARDALDLEKEPQKMRERYGLHTFGQSLLMARRLIEAGTKFVQVNWPSVANGNPETDRLGYARGELRAAEESALPEAGPRPFGAARRHGPARAAEGDAGRRDRRIRPESADGRVDVGQLQLSRRPRPLAVLLQRGCRGSGHRARHRSMANPTRRLRRPRRSRFIRTTCWRRFITRWGSIRTWRSAIT